MFFLFTGLFPSSRSHSLSLSQLLNPYHLSRKMKRVDIFCASEAATAICLGMEQNSTASPSTTTLLGGGRVIDRHNPIIKDSKRAPKPTPPTASKPQKPHNSKKTRIPPNENENQPNKTDTSSLSKLDALNDAAAAIVKRSWSCTNPGDFLSPPGSTRYLLKEKVYYNTPLSDSDPINLCLEESSNKEEPTPTEPSQQVYLIILFYYIILLIPIY